MPEPFLTRSVEELDDDWFTFWSIEIRVLGVEAESWCNLSIELTIDILFYHGCFSDEAITDGDDVENSFFFWFFGHFK